MMLSSGTINLDDICALTDFLRNHKSYVRRLKRTARPIILTINGKAQLVVQAARSYQRLLDTIDRAQAIEGIQRGLKAMRRGKGKPADKVFRRLRKQFNVKGRSKTARRNPQ